MQPHILFPSPRRQPRPTPASRAILLLFLLIALFWGARGSHAQGPDEDKAHDVEPPLAPTLAPTPPLLDPTFDEETKKNHVEPVPYPVDPAPPPSLPTNNVAIVNNFTLPIPDAAYIGTLDGNDAFGSDAGMACSPINTAAVLPAGRTVRTVSVNVALSHTWVGDLTMKLRSPSGAILTLLNRPGSTAPDNGADSPVGDSSNWADNGITFGDGAGPEAETMGATLISTQNVCAADGVCAHDPSPDTAAQPPTAFASLLNSGASGVWTLCVGDSVSTDTGALTGWTLNLVAQDPYTVNPNLSVPDDGYVGGFGGAGQSCSTLNTASPAPASATVLGVGVQVNMTHTWVGDLTMKLRSPNGTTFTFLNRPGSNAPDDGTGATGNPANWSGSLISFADGSGPEAETMGEALTSDQRICLDNALCAHDPSPDTAIQPPSAFSAFNGSSAVGNWTLCVGDGAGSDLGTLNSWTLHLARPATSLAVTLASFTATPAADRIRLAWETSSELDNLGFNLYRSTDPALAGAALNPALLPSQAPGGGQGFAYEWEDTSAQPGVSYYYTLEDVDANGTRTMHEPVTATLAPVTAIALTNLGATPGALPMPLAIALLLAPLALASLRRRGSAPR